MSGGEVGSAADAPGAARLLSYRELENGRIAHRAEPVMLVLALLVIPAIVLEEASSNALRTVATTLNVVIWIGFAAELAFVLAVS